MTWLVEPFAEFAFMQGALLGCLAIALGATPVGVFLLLRRMSLTCDAMAPVILPGAAVGYLVAGLNLGAMTIGGVIAGLPSGPAIILAAGTLYLLSLAFGPSGSLAARY